MALTFFFLFGGQDGRKAFFQGFPDQGHIVIVALPHGVQLFFVRAEDLNDLFFLFHVQIAVIIQPQEQLFRPGDTAGQAGKRLDDVFKIDRCARSANEYSEKQCQGEDKPVCFFHGNAL